MLRYLAFGTTDFRSNLVGISGRVNWEFVAVARGAVAPLFSGTSPPMRTRTLWVFPPGTPHGWMSERACVRATFHFGFVPLPLERIALERGYHECPLTRGAARRILALAAGLHPHLAHPTGVSLLHFHQALLELSLLALGNVPATRIPRPEQFAEQKVDVATAWYAEHLAERPSLRQVSQAAHVSASHLRRLFRQIRGMSPHRALSEVRMHRAMELMTHSSDPLSHIAEQCGFGSPADFARAFRTRHRTSPSQWRKGRLLAEDGPV